MKLVQSKTPRLLLIAAILVMTTACLGGAGAVGEQQAVNGQPAAPVNSAQRTSLTKTPPFVLPTFKPGEVRLTPTPDAARILPTLRKEDVHYLVSTGDTLEKIAARYGISLNMLIDANEIENPDLISVGQALLVPPPVPVGTAPLNKIIPDSELVYSPSSTILDVQSFVSEQEGYLATYSEKVLEQRMSGAEIITRVSQEYSVNPRLLLALLEYQSRWVTSANPDAVSLDYPLLYKVSYRKGLYPQLIWAANNLNRGYYLWKINAVSHYILADDSVIAAASGINAGTAAVQYLMSLLYGRSDWERAVSDQGLSQTYERLFQDAFDFSIEPLVPVNAKQPVMQLPFEKGVVWSFTGGPHGGWGDGSAWAAIDFAPPGETAGCVTNDAWVTAASGGLVTRSENGVVAVDLDLDGYEQTGWVLMYLHIESRDRIAAGKVISAGDRIGHPSCEGGVASGTHVHLARRYNGEWIAADGDIPFNFEGWVSSGTGVEYDGYLVRDGKEIIAWEGRIPENQIQR